ncbi:MAG TPA: phosphatidate cytidylyltransferase [Anaerolineaceae bacterium]|nr:phosphatidate cytidylyltransferase [Anaerolineaceae bacterium]HQN05569.1 phosphatidate cytidylyltransferase [Anaerolineaceae bacterium]
MLQSVWLAFILTLVIALLWLRLVDLLAHRGVISSSMSRKIIHAGTGLIFILCWLLFPEKPIARFLAAIIPLGITAQFALVGFGVIKDQASVDAMSRSGQRTEILRGPLFYGLVFIILTLVYWKDSPIGIVALMLLCGGDGLADIVGSRVLSAKIPWSKSKSLAGSAGMLLGGLVFSLTVMWIYTAVGIFAGPFSGYSIPIIIITAAATLIESLPFSDIDNITVPAIAVLLGHLLF